MKHVVPFYPVVCQTKKEDFFGIAKETSGGEIISSKDTKPIEILKRIRGEVVHSHGRGFPFPEMCSLFSKRSVYSPHNDTIGSKTVTRHVRRFLFNRYDRIIVQTEFGKKSLENEGVDPDKIRVIPNPVDYDFFSKKSGEGDIRKKLGLGKNEKFAAVVGIRSLKNPDVIAKACKESDIRVVMVGPSTPSQVSKTWKSKGFDWYLPPKILSRMENVITPGQLTAKETLQMFSCRPIFINSSNYENFGLAVYEAASAGLPLCLPSHGTFDSFRKCALFHKHKDQKKLSSNISKYIENPTLSSKNGSAARTVAKACDYDVVKKMFKDFYKEFIGTR